MKFKNPSIKDLRAKKPADLAKQLIELEKAQIELNQELTSNKSKQTHQIGLIKKAIARVKTVQTSVNTGKEN